uniref:Pentacotripeptide-repeat region of PRORP domain-containing protein n=1 Tax=Manihot esculenta TaxID=3983 RepID=A0A199UCL3_MANES
MYHKGLVPDIVTYNTFIKGLFQAGRPQTAQGLFHNMCSHGQQPNIVTFSIMIDGLCKERDLDEPNIVIYCILINGMCKAGKINDAKELFSRLFKNGLQPDVYICSAIMKGLCQAGFRRHNDLPKASELINEMVDKGFSADATTTDMVVHLLHNDDLFLSKLRNRSEASKRFQALFI